MGEVVLKVENLYKQYRLGLVGTGSLKDDLQRFWARLRGKEDPLSKIGESNQLDSAGGEYVWALKDINFEVKQGEVLGIIGKNGAGKSTLLKILSKVTAPTKGNIYVDGRIASLLEVGTGFHPELTGRENIFLNGAILGMKKREIRTKLDEIVDFAGIEKYLDTPVKRYSSGMYVRLAFAVAAHLEPEILIVDEVLAVGDVEFQKKAIGKMQDVSKGEGRTVLFVSHNMSAVQKLCGKTIMLKNGNLIVNDTTEKVIQSYLSLRTNESELKNELVHHEYAYVSKIEIFKTNGDTCDHFCYDESWIVKCNIEVLKKMEHFIVGLGISSMDIPINTTWSLPKVVDRGSHSIEFEIKDIFLKPGTYSITIGLSRFERAIFYAENVKNVVITDIKSEVNSTSSELNTKSGVFLNQFNSRYI